MQYMRALCKIMGVFDRHHVEEWELSPLPEPLWWGPSIDRVWNGVTRRRIDTQPRVVVGFDIVEAGIGMAALDMLEIRKNLPRHEI